MNITTQNEEQIAGSLFHDPETAWLQLNEHRITSEHFMNPLCRAVFMATAARKEKNKPLDAVLIIQSAKAEGIELDQFAWSRVADGCLTISGRLAEHIGAVKGAFLARKANSILRAGIVQLEECEDAGETLLALQSRLTDLVADEVARSGDVHHITHYLNEKVAQWRNARNSGFVGIPSSLPQLDKVLGGYRRKVMCIIGGYRGEGKSLLLRQELYSMATKGFKVLLVSLEDPEDMAAAIVAGHASRKSIFALDTGSTGDRYLNEVAATWEGLKDIPFWTASARTIEDIVTVATVHKARHGLDAIGIDHIQYISPYQRPRMDRNGTVAMYSNTICGLVKDLDCAGLVASQFARGAERDNRKPRLSDLRDSGTIEQDCRQALLLYKDGDGHVLEVAKNNFGPSGNLVGLSRIGNEHRFEYRELERGI